MNAQIALKKSLIALNSFISVLNNRYIGVDLSPVINDKRQILIYCDKGVSVQSAFGAMFCSKMFFEQNYLIRFANAKYILDNPSWESRTALLILPGGRARPYYTALKAEWENTLDFDGARKLKNTGEGNKRIQKFVESGGRYLGICAGAYYASEKTVFEKGGPLEILDEGGLKFFPGAATGPVYNQHKFSYWNKRGVKLANISIKKNEKSSISAYFNGGCFFAIKENDNCTKILAVYDDISEKPPAVIERQTGHGKVVLSGIHFEISRWMVPIYALLNPIFSQELRFSQSNNMLFFRTIVSDLLDDKSIGRVVVIS